MINNFTLFTEAGLPQIKSVDVYSYFTQKAKNVELTISDLIESLDDKINCAKK
jgi:hypothetical protein